jgi:LysM repeat protein
MSRRISFLATLTGLAMLCGQAPAEEPTALAEEVRTLRQLVEKQSKQLDALTKQVEKLTATLEGKAAPKAEAPAPKAEAEPPPPPEPSTPTEENAPKAELAGKHVVQKGETLTSIAKHYNIPLTDLQKANKDLNPAKMQIGQAITIPTTKNPEPTPEKK